MPEAKTLQQAIDAAWRRIKRSTAPAITLSPFVARAMAQSGQCGDMTAPDHVGRGHSSCNATPNADRIARYRPRPRRRSAK
jgi:hypothetical protein